MRRAFDTAKLSDSEFEIMRLLIEERVNYGWALAKRGLKLKSVYVLLSRLVKKNCISGELAIGETRARRQYKPTAHGRDLFRLWQQLRVLSQ